MKHITGRLTIVAFLLITLFIVNLTLSKPILADSSGQCSHYDGYEFVNFVPISNIHIGSKTNVYIESDLYQYYMLYNGNKLYCNHFVGRVQGINVPSNVDIAAWYYQYTSEYLKSTWVLGNGPSGYTESFAATTLLSGSPYFQTRLGWKYSTDSTYNDLGLYTFAGWS